MSQTKATKIIKAFHDNNLTSSTLKAILENDDQLFLDAVKQAHLTVGDLTLSDVEFDDLVKGTKPSGELDIIAWEGYYEVDAGPETDPRAFLILSKTEKVYWGSRSQLMGVPGDYVVNYSLTTDGKLILSTPTDGTVSIALSRTFDDEAGTTNVQVSGVCNGASFSGSQVSPPLKSDSETSTNFSIKHTRLSHGTVTVEERTLTWEDILTILGAGLGIMTAFGFFYQVFRWIKEARARRAERARRLNVELNEKAPLLEAVVEQNARRIDVNWDSAWRILTDDITSHINDRLADVDFTSQAPDQIVQSLRETARNSAGESLDRYVKQRIGSQILEILDPFRSLPSYQEIKAQVTDESIFEQVRPKLRDIGGDLDAYDPIIRALTLEARRRAFLDNYEVLDRAYNGAEAAYREAKGKREGIDRDIEGVDKKIEEAEKAKDQEEVQRQSRRKEELEGEWKRLKMDEEDKNQAKNDALKEKDNAARESRDADDDVNRDRSRDYWNEIGRDVFR